MRSAAGWGAAGPLDGLIGPADDFCVLGMEPPPEVWQASSDARRERPPRVPSTAVAFGLVGFAVTDVVVAIVGAILVGYSFDDAVRAFVVPRAVNGLSCAICGGLIAWLRPRNPAPYPDLPAGDKQRLGGGEPRPRRCRHRVSVAGGT
jgi:hypothetical protein